MNFLLCGSRSAPTVLLIHGMASTAKLCYGELARLLGKRYRIIMACLDGHDPYSFSEFKSIEKCCEGIESYIRKRFDGKVFAVSGVMLGADIALELLARGNISFEKLHLDTPCCAGFGITKPVYSALFGKGISYMGKGHRLPEIALDKAFGKGTRDCCRLIYGGMTEESVKNVCSEFFGYKLPKDMKSFEGSAAVWCGSTEKKPQASAHLLEKYMPELGVRVFKDLGHGELLREHCRGYARELQKFLSAKPQHGSAVREKEEKEEKKRAPKRKLFGKSKPKDLQRPK